jgi:hypothetical protein
VAEPILLGHRPGSPSVVRFRDSSRAIQPDTAKNKLLLLHLGDKTQKHAAALGSGLSRLQSLLAKSHQKETKRE